MLDWNFLRCLLVLKKHILLWMCFLWPSFLLSWWWTHATVILYYLLSSELTPIHLMKNRAVLKNIFQKLPLSLSHPQVVSYSVGWVVVGI